MFAEFISSSLNIFLIQTIIVITTTKTLSVVFRRIGQPNVIAEIIGGILLGPSAFGKLIGPTIFPKSSLDTLSVIGNWGLIIYLFLTGIEMDIHQCAKDVKKNLSIAAVGITCPFLIGSTISPLLYKEMPTPKPDYVIFTLFIAISMSITAFAVLCRLLSEFSLLKTAMGMNAIGAASIDDVIAWCLLAGLMSMMRDATNVFSALIVLAVSICYASFVLVICRPQWHRLIDYLYYSRSKSRQFTLLSITFLLIFTSALITDAIGIHAIFGAYLIGLIMPISHPFTLDISSKVQDLVSIIFLPLYFTLSGLRTNITGLGTWKDLSLFTLIISSAIIGKLGGCGLTSLCLGTSKKEAFAIGILMNTRGLVEIIILNIGLQSNIISEKIFTLFVCMAVCTTFMTSPAIHFIYPTLEKTYLPNDISSYDHKSGMLEPSSNLSIDVSDIGVLLIVNSSNDVPALGSLIHFFRPNDNSKEYVVVCSLSDQCLTTTDVIQATTSTRRLTMPLQLLQGMAMTLNNVELSFFNITCNPKHFAGNIIRKSLENSIDITIIPYSRRMPNEYDQFIKRMVMFNNGTTILLNSGDVTHEIICERDTIEILIVISKNHVGILKMLAKWEISFMSIQFCLPSDNSFENILSENIRQYGIERPFYYSDVYDIMKIIGNGHYHFVITDSDKESTNIYGNIGTYLLHENLSPSLLIVYTEVDIKKSSQPEVQEEDGFVQITV